MRAKPRRCIGRSSVADVLAFDLSPSLCGWCYAGNELVAGAFALPPLASDLGGLATALAQNVSTLIQRFKPGHVAYEAPILRRHDTLLDLRRIYGLGMVLEHLCAAEAIPCSEIDLRQIKTLMTGDGWAKKPEVVAAAVRIGVELPKNKAQGREDAADAVGAALCALLILDPLSASPWIAKLRGSLL